MARDPHAAGLTGLGLGSDSLEAFRGGMHIDVHRDAEHAEADPDGAGHHYEVLAVLVVVSPTQDRVILTLATMSGRHS